jgi:hypothetical protein
MYLQSYKENVLMKSNVRLLLIVTVFALIVLLGWSAKGQQTSSPITAWEHTIATFTEDNPSQLSRLGAEGWELVSVRGEERFTGNFRQTQVIYYLKRARPVQR